MSDTTKKKETAAKPEPTLLDRMRADHTDETPLPEPCVDCPELGGFGRDDR